ncbi:uncharacterized protein M421DRAFT_415303 [Didymella exigua CBS 183.55]|uniref:Uncharacterized protein n=1 Tax=Didymella exigua CBS 183.55 TaxID=1150837 RepID=A0A6A5S6Z1_9PLEO|nr:uncharacterized protein M421DRAFT_415303 [Didymella exigua CBS 183.55]KAF1934266.1 hypothetical protein M421DRAFT_415303 [Didymella exigua CBS 183.55]
MHFPTCLVTLIGLIGIVAAAPAAAIDKRNPVSLQKRVFGCDPALCACEAGCGGNAACITGCKNGHCSNAFTSTPPLNC